MVDVWRLILLTTAVLVCVLSFAASVRFLADGRLGPLETIRFMLYAMPPMLQYAVPFAAGFGATLAYHRWCNDNEISACFAAGIGHRSLLMPVVISGLVLMTVILGLSNYVIPRFLRSMESLVARDAARFIIGAIERKESVTLDNTMVYADLVRRAPDTGGGKYEKLYMKGVMFVRLDTNKMPVFEASAEEADVWLIREQVAANPGAGAGKEAEAETVTRVIVQPKGVRAREAGKQASDLEFTVLAPVIPHSFGDNPKYLTWGELSQLRKTPENLDYIDAPRRLLAARLAERAATDQINAQLAATGQVRLIDRNGRPTILHASGLRYEYEQQQQAWTIVPPTAVTPPPSVTATTPIQIDRTTEDGRAFTQTAQSALLRTTLSPSSPQQLVSLTLSLTGVKTLAVAGTPQDVKDKSGVLKEFVLDGILFPQEPNQSFATASSFELLAFTDAQLVAPAPGLRAAELIGQRDELKRQIADLLREVLSKQQERLATSVACFVMTVTGAVMALRLRSRLPLTVYLWSFFPALAAVITISAGQQLTHRQGPIFLLVLWGGVVGLMAYTYAQYRKVAMH